MSFSLGLGLSLYQANTIGPLMDQANALPAGDVRVLRQRELLQFEADNLAKIWTTIVQGLIGVVLAIGAVATWRNLHLAQDRLDVDRQAQITNRFTQAIGQLGAELKEGMPNLEVRLGAIYALERIARDSPRDHWTIVEILTAYVRQNAPFRLHSRPPGETQSAEADAESPAEQEGPEPRADIQGALTVLGRRIAPKDWPEPAPVDLGRTDLRGAGLRDAHLERANLLGSCLDGADLSRARLAGANLTGAYLREADFLETDLTGANLFNAHLERARFYGTVMDRTNLVEAHADGAVFFGARLEGAKTYGIRDADWRGVWAPTDSSWNVEHLPLFWQEFMRRIGSRSFSAQDAAHALNEDPLSRDRSDRTGERTIQRVGSLLEILERQGVIETVAESEAGKEQRFRVSRRTQVELRR